MALELNIYSFCRRLSTFLLKRKKEPISVRDQVRSDEMEATILAATCAPLEPDNTGLTRKQVISL